MILVSGPSGSGKTLLAEHIIGGLSRRGIRVSFIKDIPHDDAEFDTRGKDTYRAVTKGAVMSMGRSPSKSFINIGGYVDLKGLVKLAENYSSVCIVEGFTSEASAVKFDVRLGLQGQNVGRELSDVYARVEAGNEVYDFSLMNESADIVNFIVSFVEEQANSRETS